MRGSATVLLTLCLGLPFIWTSALAAEGRVAGAAAAAPERSRVSRYVGAAEHVQAPLAAEKDHAGAAHAAKSGPPQREKRSRVVLFSHRAAEFYIYDAGGALIADRDGDGYYSEFRIRFDADALFGDALVYAKLYVRRIGDADWLLYHTTDDFWIYGESPDDDYYVTTTLDAGFPASEYDVLIDLYEVGDSHVAATLGPQDSAALSALPLEEAGLDAPIQVAGYQIRDVSTTLLIDDDADGHYSRFRITFDPDADFDGAYLYARVWVRPQGGEWIEEHVSEDFLVDASGVEDAYSLTADWISGYPTAYYDVQIDLYDAATGLLAASAGSERPELSRLPLEDQSRDLRPNPPIGGGGGGEVTSREHGGGALSPSWALALLLFALSRLRANRA